MKKSKTAEVTANNEKKLISRIQANFAFRLFTSIILAAIIWLTINATYVNPPMEKTFYRQLSLLNRSTLDESRLELNTEQIQSSVDIYVKGRQEDVEKLSDGDFYAYIDFSKVGGIDDTSLEVELRAPKAENVSIVRIEPSEIPIAVERRVTKNFEIAVHFTGELAEGLYRTGYTYFPSTKLITARESLVNQIDRVEVEADLTGIEGNTVLHQQCKIFNADGNEMNRSGWEQIVDINLEISKDVQIIPNVTGSPAEDYYVRYVTTTPEFVRINGTKEALEQVDSLDTEVMDIGNFRQSLSQERSLLLPNNVRLSSDALPRAIIDVTIFKYQYTQDIALSKGRIEIINSQEQYRYEIVENEIPLLLKGKIEDIANLDQSQVSAVVNVEELALGTHAVSTIVSLPDGIINVNDVLLTVIVAKN